MNSRFLHSLLGGCTSRAFALKSETWPEIGDASTQELIALTRELQQGYRPDLVLFDDCVNDTTSALLEGKPTTFDQRDQPGS